MKKILLVNSGMKFNSYLFGKALTRHYDVTVTGNPAETQYEYEISQDFFDEHYVSPAELRYDDYDYIFGLEHGSMRVLEAIKEKFPKPKYGFQVLDFPCHVFKKTKDFNEGALHYWADFVINNLHKFDFTLHNQDISLQELKKHLDPNGVHKFIKYPVNPTRFTDYERKDFILYAGRVHPDKGIHYILSALSLIEEHERPEFITVGSGFDFSPLAGHLKVKYTNINNCSEKDKWRLYHESRFVVCGADNPYIPALCIVEGISVNRAGIVFDFEENHKHYEQHAWYVPPVNITTLSSTIKHMYNDMKFCDSRASHGEDYYNRELSYDAWADKFKEYVDEVKI